MTRSTDTYITAEEAILDDMEDILGKVRTLRPEGRSELGRRCAIVITELEKVQAYFSKYVVDVDWGKASA